MKRADDAAKHKQRDDRGGGLGFVHGDAEVEIIADEQRQGAFKTTERKRRQKKNQNQQTDFRLGQCVSPLGKMRATGCVAGVRLQTFGKDGKREEKIRGAKCGGGPAGSGGAEEMQGNTAERRTENKSNPNAMPMSPIRLDRFSGGVMSAM